MGQKGKGKEENQIFPALKQEKISLFFFPLGGKMEGHAPNFYFSFNFFVPKKRSSDFCAWEKFRSKVFLESPQESTFISSAFLNELMKFRRMEKGRLLQCCYPNRWQQKNQKHKRSPIIVWSKGNGIFLSRAYLARWGQDEILQHKRGGVSPPPPPLLLCAVK